MYFLQLHITYMPWIFLRDGDITSFYNCILLDSLQFCIHKTQNVMEDCNKILEDIYLQYLLFIVSSVWEIFTTCDTWMAAANLRIQQKRLFIQKFLTQRCILAIIRGFLKIENFQLATREITIYTNMFLCQRSSYVALMYNFVAIYHW